MKYQLIPEEGQPASLLFTDSTGKTIANAIMKGEGPLWIVLNLKKDTLFTSASREDLRSDFELFNQLSYVRAKGIQDLV